MRVLHLIDSGGVFGAETMLLALAAEQRKLGLSPTICSIGLPGVAEKPLEREARRRGLDAQVFRMHPGPNPAGAARLLRFARRERADILHSHGYKGDILTAFIPHLLRRVPIVATVHGYTRAGSKGRMALYEWLDRRALARVERVVLVHDSMRESFREARAGDERWVVIENGVPAPDMDPSPAPLDEAIVRFCRRGPVVGAVGRLSREKAFLDLLSAFRVLVAGGLDLRLLILGEGYERDSLEAAVASWGLQDRVLMPGYVHGAGRYLPLLDVFVLPSLTEGLPMVVLEAMQVGVAVVATRVGGVPTLLQEGRGGLLVASGKPDELARAIRSILDDPALSKRLTEASRRDFVERFSSTRMAARYLDVYRQVVAESGAAGS